MIPALIWLLLLPLAGAAVNGWLNPAAPKWNVSGLAEGEVSVAQARAWMPDALFVDARSEAAYMESHIDGAVWLNPAEFDEGVGDFLALWSPQVPVVVYCDSRQCGASATVAGRLRDDFGIPNVWVMSGGWVEWGLDAE